jgi:hypothetical protein
MSQIIDITGLSNEAAQAVETLVSLLRTKTESQAVQQVAATNITPQTEMSYEEWSRRWRAIISAHQTNAIADDSRESIYEGRGE